MLIVDAEFVAERVDHAYACAGGLGDHVEPEFSDDIPERRRAEFENGLRAIDGHVIVKKLIAGQPGKLRRDRQFPRRRRSMDDDQFHSVLRAWKLNSQHRFWILD